MAEDKAGFWKPDYSFTDEVAAEARERSRRYWERNGDRYPVADDVDRNWPINGHEPEPVNRKRKPTTRRGFEKD